MRRRIRPTTEDLEPRVVLSMTTLTPRDATPPAEQTDDSSTTPDVDRTDETQSVATGPVNDTRPTDTPAETRTTEPADVTAVDSASELKRITLLKRAQNDQPAQDVLVTGVTVSVTETDRVDEVSTTPIRTDVEDTVDDEVDTAVDDISNDRETTDDGIETDESIGVTATSDVVVVDTARDDGHAETVEAAPDVVTATLRTVEEPVESRTDNESEESETDASESDDLATASATSWIDALGNSTLSWFGMSGEGSHVDVEPLAEQTASAAGVAGVLSLMAFGRKGLNDSDRLFSNGLRGLLDLRDWRPTRSSNRRRQKGLPVHTTRKDAAVATAANLDEPEMSEAFLMSVAVPVSPESFAMSSIPADDDGSSGHDSQSTAAMAGVGVTVAAGGWAARQKLGRRNQRQSRPPQMDFGGTTFTRPDQHVG